MYAMVRVVAMFILVSTMVGGVKIETYTEKAYLSLGLIDPTQEISAEVINAEHEAHLTIGEEPMNCGAVFEKNVDNGLNDDAELGIKLNDGEEVYYHVLFFGIMHKCGKSKLWIPLPIFKNPDAISVALLLNPYDPNQEAILLEMPVFTVPEKVKDNDLLQKWAVKHRVGVITPFLQEALKSALKTGKLSLNFIWLKELLSYGIYQNKYSHYVSGDEITSYATRPLLVTKDTQNVLNNIVKKANAKTAD